MFSSSVLVHRFYRYALPPRAFFEGIDLSPELFLLYFVFLRSSFCFYMSDGRELLRSPSSCLLAPLPSAIRALLQAYHGCPPFSTARHAPRSRVVLATHRFGLVCNGFCLCTYTNEWPPLELRLWFGSNPHQNLAHRCLPLWRRPVSFQPTFALLLAAALVSAAPVCFSTPPIPSPATGLANWGVAIRTNRPPFPPHSH